MKALRVGLVGFGYVGATFHAPIISAVEGLELAAVSTSRPHDVRAALPQTTVVETPAALYGDASIDLIVITSPNDSHADLAREALLAGKHVVVEKPFVTRSADGDALIALARERGRVLSVFHNRRWDGDFLTLKQLIQDGVLGEIATFESHFDRYRPEIKNRWRESDIAGGGLLYDLGPHLLDQCVQLFGKPETLFADLRCQRPGAKAIDYVHLVLGYGRRSAILHAASLVRAPSARFVVQGSRASFGKQGLDTQEPALKRGERPGSPDWGKDDPAQYGTLIRGDDATQMETIETRRGCYENYYRELAGAIRGECAVPVSAEDGVLTIRLIEAALQSAAERRIVSFS
jgi:predicted dehydrogenase